MEMPGRIPVAENLSRVKRKIAIISGKGGVGKSTVAANLALGLAMEGKQVGLLDLDLHGPNIPKLLGVEDKLLTIEDNKIKPVLLGENLKIVSVGFLLKGSLYAKPQFHGDYPWH